MKTCKNCRFFNGQTCGITGTKKSPTNSCSNFVEYKGN